VKRNLARDCCLIRGNAAFKEVRQFLNIHNYRNAPLPSVVTTGGAPYLARFLCEMWEELPSTCSFFPTSRKEREIWATLNRYNRRRGSIPVVLTQPLRPLFDVSNFSMNFRDRTLLLPCVCPNHKRKTLGIPSKSRANERHRTKRTLMGAPCSTNERGPRKSGEAHQTLSVAQRDGCSLREAVT
jgi:hypothetical protein